MEEGSDAIFKCAANGSPPPKISWLKNNSVLPNPILIQNGSISYLVLHSLTRGHNNGVYKCVAINLAGRAYSKAGRLTVTSKAAEIPTVDMSERVGENCFKYQFAKGYNFRAVGRISHGWVRAPVAWASRGSVLFFFFFWGGGGWGIRQYFSLGNFEKSHH